MEALNPLGTHPKQSEPADQREEDEEPEEPKTRVTGLACSGSRVYVLLSWWSHMWSVDGSRQRRRDWPRRRSRMERIVAEGHR